MSVRGVTAELIRDGLHIHPSAIRMAFKLFPGRVCLISDASAAAVCRMANIPLVGSGGLFEKTVSPASQMAPSRDQRQISTTV